MKQFLKTQTLNQVQSQEQLLSKLLNGKQMTRPFTLYNNQSRRNILTKPRIFNQQQQNQQKSQTKHFSSMLLLGAGTYLIQAQWNSYINNSRSQCEAEQEQQTTQPITEVNQNPRLNHFIKEDQLQLNLRKQTLFIYYDSKNALHREFLHEVEIKSIIEKMLKKYPNLDIVQIDIASDQYNEHKLNKEVLNLVEYSQDKISKKQKPTVFIKADDRLVKFKANLINSDYADKFNTKFQKESSFYNITSVKDLAERLKQFNTNLNDTTIVYCNDSTQQSNKTKQIGMRLMRQETENPILQINDQELAQKLNMKPGRFYAYFKPSFINGFEQYVDKDINFNYLQAFEGICRDEFVLNEEHVEGEEFDNLLKQYRGLQTEQFTINNFDQFFTRSFTVEFVFNPNFQEFKRKFKTGQSTRPLMFIYSPSLYMSRYIGDFKEVLRNYTDVFDVYYTDNQKEASQVFYTNEFPDIFPYVVIIDPKKKKALKSSAGVVQDLTLKNNNFYFHKYREIIFFNDISKNLNKLIDKFLDGEIHHFYQSQKMQQATLVKKIASANFDQQVMKNPNVTQCIIEVFKHDCPSCAFNGKVYNVLSRKLDKHGYLDQLPLFRLSIDNKIPQLGNFGYSPIYLYVRKRGDQIEEIKTLDPPQKTEEFLKQIGELSKLKGFNDKIKIKARDQIIKHIKLEDLDEKFDLDFDTVDTPLAEVLPGTQNTTQQQQQQATKTASTQQQSAASQEYKTPPNDKDSNEKLKE